MSIKVYFSMQFEVREKLFEKISKFFMAKSRQTGIRLRGDTFGGSQSPKIKLHLT